MSVEFNLSNAIKAPVVSEKSTVAAENDNRFVFKVANQATKLQVKKSVELMFNVEVEKVQLLNVKGKTKRFGRFMGKRSDWKKAYVKLKPGHDIDFSAA
ncbi:large subunit ribosomal protein L23 [Bathymodiolus platifrons methanotrophic gill symbiont]|uniref:50S ribosomal protein L23 n=1 Tax=Bathymodiolus platifrons methanotrophic gill symbiont TaxID=113268 RepID=UPI000B40F25E|nr:50S ribosomal protein L23 [Bathymodiolus platifrons methanotrophic gill symbiont]MCK5869078.1 50S ribosomal protein L23 [Methyloprofundus sp.]TXK97415.1 50S ribosomal protein L23 [Methylococcaceae bacterium CS4]TXK99735.1 50S ribosomal protein L23 [Methylococcaceae bacterium CS5]TXL06585.1 50S ribosomal protein L23 [Methylococcaceae bacterium CS1]TXL09526.1 50S ribosomal protein L23 [Methylococcaceae bacterium CS3]TXL12162.1 50S ribosomal protein L23 [Methylococcaceae bacterium CS2]